MTTTIGNDQHNPGKSIFLHLLPGILIGGCYFAVRPILSRLGYPSILALMGAIILVLLPVELGWLLYEAKKKNNRLSLQGIVLYRNPIPIWQYFLWIPVLFIALGLIFTLMKPVDGYLREHIFSWLPAYDGGLQVGYSRNSLVLTWVMVAVFGMVTGPLVEELYFRGYLLPRMGFAGKWAPFLHSLLFGLYHIWTPWMFLTRTVGMLPLALATRWRNITLAIVVHILMNSIDVITAVVFIAGMSGPA